MAKKKKSEIDAILEQLKNSYFDDSQDIEEESSAQDYVSEEDAELAAVLERIFTTSEDVYGTTNEESEALSAEDTSTQSTVQESDIITSAPEEVVTDATIAEETVIVSQEVEDQPDDVKSEQDRVDDVLRSMFHVENFNQVESKAIEPDDIDIALESDESTDADLMVQTEPDVAESIVDEEINISDEMPVSMEIPIEDAPVCEDAPEIDESPIDEDSGFELIPDEERINPAFSELDIEDLSTVYLDEVCDPVEETPQKKKVTSPDEYIDDIMQHSISGISFYKPQRDVDFSIIENIPTSIGTTDNAEAPVISEEPESKSEITDKDISLLMKLGYSGEINASGENEHAHKVIFDESKDYIPDKHKIAHGFSGKEYSSRAQIPAIQRKFKTDRTYTLIRATIVSVLAMAAVILDLMAALSYVKHTSLASFSLLYTSVALAVMLPRVVSGIVAIFRFDTNQYSLPSLILIESFGCNLIMAIFLAVATASMTSGAYYSVNGYAILYMALAAWSEWIDCCRESGTFNFIANNNSLFVAERRTSADASINESNRKHTGTAQENDGRYFIKQANFISGFHKKTVSESHAPSRIFLSIGIIPSIAIIVGMLIAIVNDSLVSGISGIAFIFSLSAPLLGIISYSLIELFSYFKLKKGNSVLIGRDAADAIAGARSLVFRDRDAIEVVAYTPINPNKNADNPKKGLNIAARVFETLGGPLSTVKGPDKSASSNIAHDVAINAISDNGIDIYFDSSMNILIGDRAYMQAHNIKVKTDVNLTGATRGSDRSVIYMAFDKVPQIGFIVTSNVKKSFRNNINVEVKSYEPEINEYFFEQNIPECQINTVKPPYYESNDASDVSDCELVSSNPLDICRSAVYARVIADDHKKIKSQRKIQSVIGFIASLALAALICLPSKIQVIGTLQAYSPVLFYLVALALIIPNVIHIIKVIKRK